MPRKLLVLTRYYYPAGSGAELATKIIVEEILAQLYDEILVLTGEPRGEHRPHPRVLVRSTPVLRGSKPAILAKTMRSLDKLLELIKHYDTVYVPSNALLFVPGMIRGRYRGRIIVHLHDYQAVSYTSVIFHNTSPGPWTDYLVETRDYNRRLRALLVTGLQPLQRLYNKGYCAADVAITVSNRQRQLINKYSPCKPGEEKTIYNPLPPRLRNPKPITRASRGPEKPLLLYIGGARLTKGYPIVLRTLTLLERQSSKDIELLLAKIPSTEWKKVSMIAKAKDIEVHAYPQIPRETLFKTYEERRPILLHPSLHEEPLPYTVIEAAILGAKPLASRLGGVPEILANTPAHKYLHSPGDAQQLAKQVEEALGQDPIIAAEEAIETREKLLERLQIDNVREEIEKIFL